MRGIFYAPVTTTTIVSCRVYEMRNDRRMQAEGRKDVLGRDEGNNARLMLTICLAMTPYEQKYVFSACLINGTYLSTSDKRDLCTNHSSLLIDCMHTRV